MKKIISIFLAVLMVLTIAPLSSLADTDWAEFFGTTEVSAASSMKDIVASKSVGDTIEFGYYPQSQVTDSSLISALNSQSGTWVSYRYYILSSQSDFMKYKDVTYNGEKYRAVTFSKYRPSVTYCSSSLNSYQDDGYSTGNIYWFKYEPLTWRILDPSTGYVICETIIDSQAFNNKSYSSAKKDEYGNTAYYNDNTYSHYCNNWEYSTIRTWLNKIFYTTAFTESERSQIPCTKLTTPEYLDYRSKFDVGETGDYVFLPSCQDMMKTSYGFSSDYITADINRRAHASDYAKSQGILVNTSYTDSDGEYTSYYYCRTAGNYTITVSYVRHDGYVYFDKNTYLTDCGVRPALCFNPSSTSTYVHEHSYDSVVTAPTCENDGYTTYTCSSCGEKYEGNFVDATGHTNMTKTAAKAATCTATGNNEYYTCSTCKKVFKDATGKTATTVADETLAALGHDFDDSIAANVTTVDATCTTAGSKTVKCSRCDKTEVTEIPAKGHSWNEGAVTTAANCVDTGVKTYTCTVCNATKTETISVDSTNHKTVVTDAAVAATCTKTGLTEGSHCSRCNTVLKAQQTVKALGHNWDNGKITTEPTCDKEGVKTYTCTVCKATKTESVAKLVKTEPDYELGNVDGKDGINVADARLALRRAIGLENYAEDSAEYLACDVNLDGEVKVDDARLILRAAINLDDPKNWKKA